MAGALNQDHDAHAAFTFIPVPERPMWRNRLARARRLFTIAFAESWLAAWLFRAKVRLRASGIPMLPGLCDMASRALFRVSIGDHVAIGPGLMMTHGNVVIDGRTKIGANCQINPWVTIGLSNSKRFGFSADGPTIGNNVHVGTGAKILGPISIGDHVRIGANAVVIHDVPPNVTVVGVPARVVGGRAPLANGAGSERDRQLVARMCQSIVDYRLHRQSLRSLVDALSASFESGSPRLRTLRGDVNDDLIFLAAAAATGGQESPQVAAAIDAVTAALNAEAAT